MKVKNNDVSRYPCIMSLYHSSDCHGGRILTRLLELIEYHFSCCWFRYCCRCYCCSCYCWLLSSCYYWINVPTITMDQWFMCWYDASRLYFSGVSKEAPSIWKARSRRQVTTSTTPSCYKNDGARHDISLFFSFARSSLSPSLSPFVYVV